MFREDAMPGGSFALPAPAEGLSAIESFGQAGGGEAVLKPERRPCRPLRRRLGEVVGRGGQPPQAVGHFTLGICHRKLGESASTVPSEDRMVTRQADGRICVSGQSEPVTPT